MVRAQNGTKSLGARLRGAVERLAGAGQAVLQGLALESDPIVGTIAAVAAAHHGFAVVNGVCGGREVAGSFEDVRGDDVANAMPPRCMVLAGDARLPASDYE